MSEHTAKTVRELRKFGLAFGGGLTLLGSLALWRGKAAWPWVLGVAAVVLTLAVLAPAALRPLEKLLSTLFRWLTAALTYVILVVTFFVVVTPIGLVMRLLGKDPLHLERQPKRPSFWAPVELEGPASRPDKPY
jgi:hypothetical protein